MTPWSFVSRDPEETHAIGRELGRAIGADGLVLALVGPLGAGKTVFVKGLAEGLGVEPRAVSSPTFVIAQQYAVPEDEAAAVLHHVDLYRLESEDELETIGFFDMFAGGSVLAVEWADRFPGVLGRDVLRVDFEGPSAASERPRTASVSAEGGAAGLAERVGEDWRVRVERLRRAADEDARARPPANALLVWLVASMLAIAVAAGRGAVAEDLGAASIPTRATPACARIAPARGDTPDDYGARRVQRVTAGAERTGPAPGRAGQGARPTVDAAHAVARSGSARDRLGVARLLFGGRLDPNRATAAQLRTLPGLGPSRVEALLAHRARTPFATVADLERVPGIGPVTRARLERWLAVPGSSNAALPCEADGARRLSGGVRQ